MNMPNIKKRVLGLLDRVYTVNSMMISGKTYFVAATHAQGKCLLFSPPDWELSTIWENPGGTMGIVPLSSNPGGFLAVQNFFPFFKSEKACIVYAEAKRNKKLQWNVRKILNLPFVHRISLVNIEQAQYLIASTICGGKEFQDDWSKPGTVYAIKIPSNINEKWESFPIIKGISKNHGLFKGTLNKKQVLLISGSEGVFLLNIPYTQKQTWTYKCLIEKEISDIFLYDIDNDGKKEIIAIEPFHGDIFNIYKLINGKWQSIYMKKINMGHSLWCGKIMGKQSILIGNRMGEKELMLLQNINDKPLRFKSMIIDKDVGPTQLKVMRQRKNLLILSANNHSNEVALYEVRG
jgi:hypothetical protein